MAQSYARLSGQDASFLLFEGPSTPMNVGGTSVFEGRALIKRDGAVDVERIKQYVAAQLPLIPRYRQKLAYIPIEQQPIWIDDERFDLDYHMRHIALPRPGNAELLKRLSADILSRPLDRQRPLWELWVIEGLGGGRFATVTKTHHCMVDGVSGVELVSAMMRTTPDASLHAPPPWRPRPAPRRVALWRDEVLRRARLPAMRQLANAAAAGTLTRSDLTERMAAVWSTLRVGLRGAANTPFNQPIGGYRRFDWLSIDLDEVKEVKNQLGGTVNDVVLATVAGAVRRFLRRRQVSLTSLKFRVATPVNMRAPGDRAPGNRVSVWLAELPIQDQDPRRRLARVCETTAHLKQTKQAFGPDLFQQLADWAGPAMVTLGTRFASRMSPYNLLVTNVAGPPFPLYMLGAKVVEAYPLPPLFENQGLGVALFSYADRMFWGFAADWDLVPDLPQFVEDVDSSFDELHRLARLPRARSRHAGSAGSRGAPRKRRARAAG